MNSKYPKTYQLLKSATFIKYAPLFKIITPHQKSLFISQLISEVGEHPKRLEESFKYTYGRFKVVFGSRKAKKAKQYILAKDYVTMANIVYGGRMGNNKRGDGWKYRGRGFIQLTGKYNYGRVSKELKKIIGIDFDLVRNPNILTTVDIALLSAFAYWHINKIHTCESVDCATNIINKHAPNRKERRVRYGRVLREIVLSNKVEESHPLLCKK